MILLYQNSTKKQNFEKEKNCIYSPCFHYSTFMRYIILFLSLITLASCSFGWTESTLSSESKTIPTPTYGKGNHTIEIYADFQCPACINFHKSLGPLLESYASSGKVVLEYRQFPLTSIHKNAYRDALAALCGAEAGKYKDMKTALYALEEKKSGATVSDDERVEAAKSVGIDESSFRQCLSSGRYSAQVDADIARGDSLGVQWTPSLFLDGKKLDLGIIFSDFELGKKWLDSVLSK